MKIESWVIKWIAFLTVILAVFCIEKFSPKSKTVDYHKTLGDYMADDAGAYAVDTRAHPHASLNPIR